MKSIFICATCLLAMAYQVCNAATYYVDPQLASDCVDYSPAARSCNSGSETVFSNLDDGLAAVSSGDTLFLRSGTYGQLNVVSSGTRGNPIVISGYDAELAVINSASLVGINVIARQFVVIQNLTVRDVLGFGRLEDSANISIRNTAFENARASGTTGSMKLVRTTNSRVIDNSFVGGSDLFILQDDSDRNVVEGNSFSRATHSLISIRCSNENVIRGNDFANPIQKAVEIFDCEAVSDAPFRLDSTKRNLFERNRFLETAGSDRNYRYNAIQHGGQHTIVRSNVFANNLGGGVNFQYYSDESLNVYGNRLYNNTFVDNRCYAIIGAATNSSTFRDNVAVNNLIFRNVGCAGESRQTDIGNTDKVILISNGIAEVDPGFANISNLDFRLDPSSAYIDIGGYVATTATAGSGSVVQVDDASWFFDGFGIDGEQGDEIRVEGTQTTARIVSIDYDLNQLTLDRSVTWDQGSGIHLKYFGIAPDIGAFEFNDQSKTPEPPANLQ